MSVAESHLRHPTKNLADARQVLVFLARPSWPTAIRPVGMEVPVDTLSAQDEQAIREAFRRADEADAFWAAHYAELLERYPEQYVAIHQGEVVANHPDPLELDRMLEGKGLDPREVWVKLITTHPRYLILW